MTTPLRAVLSALADGAGTRAAVVTATGLSADLVDAALDHLVRMGHVEAQTIAAGCPTGGCGHCASASGCGGGTGRGLVAFTVRRSG